MFVWLKGNKPLSKEEKYVEICYDFKEISSLAKRKKDSLILRNHFQFLQTLFSKSSYFSTTKGSLLVLLV